MKKYTSLLLFISVIITSATFFIYNDVFAVDGWLEQTGSGQHYWSDIASSADGTKLVAADLNTFSINGGYIYTSTDSGVTWTQQTGSGLGKWSALASSADGTKLVAVNTGIRNAGGYVYTSTDSGMTWTQQTGSGQRHWSDIASSADGTKLVAVNRGDRSSSGYIYTSVDSGVTWTEQTASGSRIWEGVASSSDGTKLVAVGSDENDYIYTSTDSGVTWTEQVAVGNRIWASVASSADGTKLVAGATSFNNNEYIYTSTDSGMTWTQQTGSGQEAWSAVASSGDGTKILAIKGAKNETNYLTTSNDGGVTWVDQIAAGERDWSSVAISADGLKPSATDSSNGYIYTYGPILISEVETGVPSSINKIYALLNGEVTSTGNSVVTERGFQYGIDTSYGNTVSQSGSFNTGSFSRIASSLTCGTTYHFRAYSINAGGTAYGEDATFTTTNCSESTTLLYGVDGYVDDSSLVNLYILDKESGTKVQTIGPIGFNIRTIAFNPTTNILYGSDKDNLYTVNTTNGTATILGAIEVDYNQEDEEEEDFISINAIAISTTGTMYAWSSTSDGYLFTIDTNSCNGIRCFVTQVGSTENPSLEAQAMSFNGDNGLYIFSYDDSSYMKINLNTGEINEELYFSNSEENGYEISSVAFDNTDTMYASRTNYGDPEADLITIDVDTGEITSRGQNEDMVYMSAIAFVTNNPTPPAPTPSPTNTSNGGSRMIISHPGCKDINALNYDVFSTHEASLCLYKKIEQPTPLLECSTITVLIQNLKQGATDGKFNTYTKTIVREVTLLQEKLNLLSFNPGIVDGIFGKKTVLAVKKLQTSFNIKNDGIVGPITRSVINSLCK